MSEEIDPEVHPRKPRLLRARDYFQNAVHLSAAAALTVLSGFWAGPKTLAISAGIAGLLAWGGNKLLESNMSRIFEKREVEPDDHSSLAATVSKLTRRLGFKEEPSLYDYKLDQKKLDETDELSNSPAQFQRVYNAAAGGLAKRSLIVSTPLLNLLQPKETDAVMAHEFGHMGTAHGKVRLVAGWLQTTTMFAAMGAVWSAIGDLGGMAYIGASLAAAVIGHAGRKMMPDKKDVYTRDGEIKPRAQRVKIATMAAQELVSVGLLAIRHPVAVLAAVATEHGFFWSANLVTKSLNRRQEFQADRAAVELGADPLALVTSLRKIVATQERDEPELSASLDWRRGTPVGRGLKMAVSLLKDHPDTERRCRRLAKLAAGQGRSVEEITRVMMSKVDISHDSVLRSEPKPWRDRGNGAGSGVDAADDYQMKMRARAELASQMRESLLDMPRPKTSPSSSHYSQQ